MRGNGVRLIGVLLFVAGATRATATEMVAERFIGREFWGADLPVWDGDSTPYSNALKLVIMNPGPDPIRVDVVFQDPTLPLQNPLIDGGGTKLVDIGRLIAQSGKTCSTAPCAHVIGAGTAPSPVFRITVDVSYPATASFAAAMINPSGGVHRSDMTFLIPTCSMGTSHHAGTYVNHQPPTATCNRPANSADSWIAVIAAQDATDVEIFDDTSGTPVLVDSQTLFNKGAYYLWNAGSDPSNPDGTGYRIVTSKIAAVYSGSDCTAIGLPSIDCNSLLEAVMPDRVMEDTGSAYVALPTQVRPFTGSTPCSGADCTEDVFRFIAHSRLRLRTNPTRVNGCDLVVLEAGEFAECRSSTPFLIHSHDETTDAWPGPTFSGFQYLVSQDAVWATLPTPGTPPAIRSAGVGDPAMVAIMPLSTWACRATLTVPDGFDSDKHYVHVVRPQGAQIQVDGVDATSTCTPIPTAFSIYGLNLCTQHVPVTATPGTAVHLVSMSGPMSVIATGFGPYDAYAWAVPGHEANNAPPYVMTCPSPGQHECGTGYSPPAPTVDFLCAFGSSLTPALGAVTVASALASTTTQDPCTAQLTEVELWNLTGSLACGPALSCVHQANVLDTIPPSITAPADVTVECGAVPAAPTLAASDSCDLNPAESFSESIAGTTCLRTITRRWTATDRCGNSSFDEQVITVTDTLPPHVEPNLATDEACLKQANHKYFCYENFSSHWTITDACSCLMPLTVACESSEPENSTGDGNTTDDCVYDDDHDVLCVRAERKGNNRDADREHPGRTYTVTVVATDCCGNSSAPVQVFRVYVPHDSSMNPESDEGIPLPCDKPKDSSCCSIGSH
jgi:hypothetical protein